MVQWTVLGGGGVAVPGGVKEKTGCGPESHGRVGRLVFSR